MELGNFMWARGCVTHYEDGEEEGGAGMDAWVIGDKRICGYQVGRGSCG